MRVLVVKPDQSNPGGVANYYSLVKEHLGKEVDFFIVGSRRGEHGFIAMCIRVAKDTMVFWRTLKMGKYQLVHLNPSMHDKAVWRDGVLLLMIHARGVKSIVFFRGWVEETERRVRRWYLGLFRRVYFRADAMIVLASQFEASLREMGYWRPIYVETTAVSDEIFQHEASDIQRLGGSESSGRFNILFLSRMDVNKGIGETLEAYRILRAKYPIITLIMAGDGPKFQWAKERATHLSLPDVEFPGYVVGEGKHHIFDVADVYLLPTYGEGMPNSVLEAMAYGLPVVTRPVGGLRDFFEDGKMGFITESLDPVVFADLLERLLLDPDLRKKIGGYNRKYAFEHFRASIVAKRLIHIYEDVIGKHRPD